MIAADASTFIFITLTSCRSAATALRSMELFITTRHRHRQCHHRLHSLQLQSFLDILFCFFFSIPPFHCSRTFFSFHSKPFMHLPSCDAMTRHGNFFLSHCCCCCLSPRYSVVIATCCGRVCLPLTWPPTMWFQWQVLEMMMKKKEIVVELM